MGRTMREMVQDKGPDYRREILEEIYLSEVEYDMDSVFVIKDVSVINGIDVEEIVDGVYSLTKSEAWERLSFLAGVHDIELNQNEYSFDVPTPPKGVDQSYYYIEELWRG